MAINKDNIDRSIIVKKLEEIESFMESDGFTNKFDVYNIGLKIGEVIGSGYENCVLQNDEDIERRCIVIHNKIIEYTKKQLKTDGTLTKDKEMELDNILEKYISVGFLAWITLSDELKTSDEQHAWMIMSSLIYPNKITGGLADVISWHILSEKNKNINSVSDYVGNHFESMKNKLLDDKIISRESAEEIDKMIKNGLSCYSSKV